MLTFLKDHLIPPDSRVEIDAKIAAGYFTSGKQVTEADLVKTVVDNVLKSLNDPKTQKDVLASAVAEIERECTPFSCVGTWGLMRCLVLQSWSRARLSRRYCSQYVVGSADRFNVQLLLLNSFGRASA